MAIVEMSKIKLVALEEDKQNILNALVKSGSVELSESKEIADTFCISKIEEKNAISINLDKAIKSIDFVTECINQSINKDYYPKDADKYLKNFFVSYDEFLSIYEKQYSIQSFIDFINDEQNKLVENRAGKIKLNNTLTQLLPYENVLDKFTEYKSTKETSVFFGTIKEDLLVKLQQELSQLKLTSLEVVANGNENVIAVISHREESEEVNKILGENGFNKCPFDIDCTAKEKIFEVKNSLDLLDREDQEVYKTICTRLDGVHDLKVYADYLSFLLEKNSYDEKFRRTSKTFVLEGFLPTNKKQEIESLLNGVTNAIFIEFSMPEEGEVVPTLTENNKLVKQTEFITDMYSVPKYREFDPNKSVFVFFMMFMGLIMADMGYGIIMFVLGRLLASKIKVDNGTRRLWNVIAIGGVFAFVFGAMFNSLFGFEVLPFTLLKAPVLTNGIENLKLYLLGCFGLGAVHIAVGYLFKAINCFMEKNILDGILDGLLWVVFFVALILGFTNMLFSMLQVEDYVEEIAPWLTQFLNKISTPAIYVLLGVVIIEALTAGRHERGFGKFTKGFGAVYGLINILSDILSYARIFGLMLSGMIIASTFNDMGVNMFSNGIVGYVAGGLIIAIGHIFNIAMGVLGAYIHDSRLQYIEYFGKFYSGEGEKFKPLGSKQEFIYITK